MAQKKKKKKANDRSPSEPLSSSLLKVVFGVFLLLLIVIGTAWLANRYLAPGDVDLSPKIGDATKPASTEAQHPKITYEIYPAEDKTPRVPSTHPVPDPNRRPRIAIIVDDLGYDFKTAEQFLSMDANWTFSILPHSPFGKKIAAAAEGKHLEIMLHLPMEPEEYPKVDPGPGTLLVNMGPDRLISELNRDLDFLPGIKGVNNHMGSKMTANSTQLYQIFSNLKKRNLYFVDSRTTTRTLCEPSAKLFRVPFASRDVFLDHVPEDGFIRKQIRLLVKTAQRRGYAVGIAHPHRTTLDVLRDEIGRIKDLADIVPASQIVRVDGST